MKSFTHRVGAIALALLGATPAIAQVAPAALSGSEVVRVVDRGATKSLPLAQVQGLQTPPTGFRWDFAAHPLNVFRSPNGRYYTDLDPRSVPSIAPIFSRTNQTAGTTLVTYADASRADNSGDGLTVKRADGAAPTDANTRVLLASDVLNLGPNAVSFYMSGFTVMGGFSATLQDNTAAIRTKDVVVQDSYFAYPAGAAKNAVLFDNVNGFVGFWRVTANKGSADSFNPHFTVTGGAMDWLLVDPVSYDLGRTGSVSNNCLTAHEGGQNDVRVRLIALNGVCRSSAGGAIRPIGGSQMWLAGYGKPALPYEQPQVGASRLSAFPPTSRPSAFELRNVARC